MADDLALALAAADVRIEAPVPGKAVIGIEVPNKDVEMVYLREVIEDPAFSEHPSKVALALGKDIYGQPVIADLTKWLHLLVAGATGSGKSVCLNCMIASLLFRATPEEVKILMIDPKRVELAVYDGIPHLIAPVVTDPRKLQQHCVGRSWKWSGATNSLQSLACGTLRCMGTCPQSEEEEREHLPYIVVIIDELADLMMVAAAEVEMLSAGWRKWRAAGIYLIVATQRPSVDVITGLIKANVPTDCLCRIQPGRFKDHPRYGRSRTAYRPRRHAVLSTRAAKPTRAQGAWISDDEIEALVNF